MCDIPAAGASPATRCASDVAYELYQEVDAQNKFGEGWFKAFIIKKSGFGKRLTYKVHFSGWGQDRDENLAPDKLRMRTEGAEVGPRGDELVAQIKSMYDHVHPFIPGVPQLVPPVVSKEFRRLPNPERPAVARCNTAPLTHEESQRLEQLALHLLKQELFGITKQPRDQRLLESVRIVMRKWCAVSVPVIVEKALIELGLQGRVRGGKEARSGLVCDNPEIICISSDDDSIDRDSSLAASKPKPFFEAANAHEPPSISTTPVKARNPSQGTAEAVIIADPDCDSVGRDNEPAPAPSSSVVAAPTSRPHRNNRTKCPVQGCTGSWISVRDQRRHENGLRHVAAVLKESLSALPCAASVAAPSTAPPVPVLTLDSGSHHVADAIPSTPVVSAAPAASAAAACAVIVSSAPQQPAPKRGRPKKQQQYPAKPAALDAAPAAAIPSVCCPSGDCASASSGSILRDAGEPDGHDDECMVCHLEGELLMCDYQGCKKTAHLKCAGLNENPEDDEAWYCALHSKIGSVGRSDKIRCGRTSPIHSVCSYCQNASASCQCHCLECNSSRGTRIRCPNCNRCFHQ
jgi:hypothetical protein